MSEEICKYEAFNSVKETIKLLEIHYDMYKDLRYKIAIKALEKQIPFRPERYKGFYGQCKCKAIFLDKLTEYCGNCGQRLDWSEVEE